MYVSRQQVPPNFFSYHDCHIKFHKGAMSEFLIIVKPINSIKPTPEGSTFDSFGHFTITEHRNSNTNILCRKQDCINYEAGAGIRPFF